MKMFTTEERKNAARQSYKCSKEEAQEFKNIVIAWLKKNNLSFTKVVASTSYYGRAKIYNGKVIFSIPLRRSRKLLAFKNPLGIFEGTPEGIERLKKEGGTCVYEIDYHPRKKKDYYPLYRTEFSKDIKDNTIIDSLRNFLK